MTSLTDLQRWAREKGTPLAPQALRTLKAEGFLEAEAVATLPSSELRKLPYVKESSIAALRAWQAEQGIPVPPDPEVEAPERQKIWQRFNAVGEQTLRDMIDDRVSPHLIPGSPYLPPADWYPRNEKENVAWSTYLELLKPSPVMGERVNPVEAMKQAWLAADAWEDQRKKRETKGETNAGHGGTDDAGQGLAAQDLTAGEDERGGADPADGG